MRVQAIADRQGIPHRYLEQIFQRLRRAELVRGKRGPGGGYVLNRPPEEISLRAVVEAVEGPLEVREKADREAWTASPHRPDFLWADVARRASHLLDDIVVADVCREAVRKSVTRDLPEALDYQI